MTVYVIVSNYVCVDSGDFDCRVDGVYESFDKAYETLKKLIEETRGDFKDYDIEESFVAGDMSWSIWKKGEYPSHHCDIAITEAEIQQEE